MTRIGKGGSGIDPVAGYTLVHEGDFAGLYVCDRCGWHVLAVDVGRHSQPREGRCAVKAGAAADKLAARVPNANPTKHGSGYGHLCFNITDKLHVKFSPSGSGKFFQLDEVWSLLDLTEDKATALVEFLAAWSKS